MRRHLGSILAAASFIVLVPAISARAQYGLSGGGGGSGGLGGGFGGIGSAASGLGIGGGRSFGGSNYGGFGYGNNISNTYGAGRMGNMPFSRGAVNAIRTWPSPNGYGYSSGGGRTSYRTGPNVPIGGIYGQSMSYYSAYGQGPSPGYYATYMNRGYVPQRMLTPVISRRVAPRTYYYAAPRRYYYSR